MKRILSLILLLLPFALWAQEGTWSGRLDVGGQKLRVVFHLTQTSAGWQATMDSPDQGVRGIPVDSVAVSRMGVTFAIRGLAMTYMGGFMDKDNLVGTLNQQGRSLMLMLTRGEPERPSRPQEPATPYPYHEEEVSFVSRDRGLKLHGTLTLPKGEGTFAAVVLVTGSGTQDRNETLMDHKPFLVLADRLTRAGYAVLRYDDRGYGATTEEQQALQYSTTYHLMLDALGAFDWLCKHPRIDPRKVGIGGHSEGGSIALMALGEESKVAYALSLAGMTTTGAELLVTQNRAIMLQQGVPASLAEGYARAMERLFAAYLRAKSANTAPNVATLVAEAVVGESLPDAFVKNLHAVAVGMQKPWLNYFLALDPLAGASRWGNRPVWAANGGKDLQVDAVQNLGRLEALQRSNITTRRYEGLNHLFQPCTTGLVTEYSQIETTLSEEVMQELIAWLNKQLKE